MNKNIEEGKKEKYWQELWVAVIVSVILTVWFSSLFLIGGAIYLILTRKTINRKAIAWRTLIKRTVIIEGILIALFMVIMLVFSFAPLLGKL